MATTSTDLPTHLPPALPRRRRPVGALVGALFGSILLLISSGVVIFLLPKFALIFNDFGTQVPAITAALINAPRVLVAIAAGLAIATLFTLAWVSQYHPLLRALSWLANLLAVASVIAVIIGVFMVLPTLIDSLAAP